MRISFLLEILLGRRQATIRYFIHVIGMMECQVEGVRHKVVRRFSKGRERDGRRNAEGRKDH